MRRIPALLPVSAFAGGLVLAVTGCSSGGSWSTQAEQAMYAAVSRPARRGHVAPGRAEVGRGPGEACGWRSRSAGSRARGGPAPRAARGRARPAQPSVLNAVMPGWGRPGSVNLADPGSPGGSSGDQAVMSLSCAAADSRPAPTR